MIFFKLIEEKLEDRIIKNFIILGISVFRKEVSLVEKKKFLFGVRIFYKKLVKENIVVNIDFNFLHKSGKKIQIWFDHSLGGGTEFYSLRKFEELKKDYIIIRLQGLGTFVRVTYFGISNEENSTVVIKLNKFFTLIKNLSVETIVINNLVGYQNINLLLQEISYLKKTSLKIKFLLHDFFCICPSINMIDDSDYWCDCRDFSKCSICLKKIKNRLPINVISIKEWHKLWEVFFYNYVDEIVVFSKSSFEILCRYYPNIKEITKIIPHKVSVLRKVNIKSHEFINIATIGYIGFNKGINYLFEIDKLINNFNNINMYVIGYTNESFVNIKQTGKYNIKELPDLVEQLEIDAFFILSICPETFSYTTSEAISMGVPVICFNLGAQAEKVSSYDKGLVLNKAPMKDNLNEIVSFIKTIRIKEKNIKYNLVK